MTTTNSALWDAASAENRARGEERAKGEEKSNRDKNGTSGLPQFRLRERQSPDWRARAIQENGVPGNPERP
jgi:hypothetical protein